MGDCKKITKMYRLKKEIIRTIRTYEDGCDDNEIRAFEEWISSKNYLRDLEEYDAQKHIEDKLDEIIRNLKTVLPKNAVLPSETIIHSESGPNNDCRSENSYHADAFLYNDQSIEHIFSDKNRSCEDCGSHNIVDTLFISHSLSRPKLEYLFKIMLPSDCSNKKILDVGSRIGAVLYGAYFYSNCQDIYGIEMNKELCEIQQKIISSHNMNDRIHVINDDILNQGALISIFDIVILNNVFEFFFDRESQIKIWKFLKKMLKKGCVLVTIPSAEETFTSLDIYVEFSKWLEFTPPYQEEGRKIYTFEDEAEFHDMYLYTVK